MWERVATEATQCSGRVQRPFDSQAGDHAVGRRSLVGSVERMFNRSRRIVYCIKPDNAALQEVVKGNGTSMRSRFPLLLSVIHDAPPAP